LHRRGDSLGGGIGTGQAKKATAGLVVFFSKICDVFMHLQA